MIRQHDVDKYFQSISLKRQKIFKDQANVEKLQILGAPLTTEALHQQLQDKDEKELSPRSLKNKQILMDIKESEVRISESLKKITDIQQKLSDRDGNSQIPNFNLNKSRGGQANKKRTQAPVNDLEPQLQDLQLKQQIRFASNSLPEIGEMVKSQLKKRFHKDIVNGHICEICYQTFESKWELNRHLPQCKNPCRGFTRLSVNGSYSCLICSHESDSKDDLKKHLFYSHSEVDILSKYGQPFQRIAGDFMHTRLRMPMLTRIGNGKFDKAIETIIEKVDKFEISSLDFLFPWHIDEDPINKARRKHIYRQKREMLMKIAILSKEASLTIGTDDEDGELNKTENQLYWDLSIDYSKEWIPDQVIRGLRFSIMALRKKMKYVPTFKEFYKDGSMVMIKYSNLPLRLRSLIGRRNQMYLHGSKIIKHLLLGLLELKNLRVKVFNIDPSSIHLSEDFSKLNFSEIRHMASNDENQCPVITTSLPYCGLFGLLKEREEWESQARDMYSIGLVILEIIVGTELAIMTKRPLQLTKLLLDLTDYLDEQTMALLNHLILDKEEVDIPAFIDTHLSEGHDKIQPDILRVKLAVGIDQNLKSMAESFQIYMQFHADECYRDHQLISMEIVNKISQNKIDIKEKN